MSVADFQLTNAEKSQHLWVRLKAHLEDRLAAARAKNDLPQSEAETATIRGEIHCLKALIRLDADRPVLSS